MTIIVTGGAGFIGTNFIFYQLKNHPDDRIVCLDKLTYAGNISNLDPVMNNPNFRFFRADITDKKAVNNLFSQEKPDIVVNFAAETHVDRSLRNAELFLKTNVIGVQTLLDACIKNGVKRFHQISTDEVYGDLPLDRPDLCFAEESALNASSPYSASKASADIVALSYYKTFCMHVTITRCSNNYGPYQFPEKLIPLTICRALKNQSVPIYGDGKNVRDWLYVEDHCRAVDLVMRNGKAGEIYNVGADNEKSNLETVSEILNELGKSEALITHIKDRPGHDRRYSVDFSKTENELGWKPETEFKNGIGKTVKWYLENPKWFDNTDSDEYKEYFDIVYGKALSE